MRRVLLSGALIILTLPVVSSAAVIGKPANNLGLIGYWPMNEGSGTGVGDFSGNRNNATTSPVAPAWASGKMGGALSFNGNTTYVSANSSASLNRPSSEITISAWVYANQWVNDQRIVEKKTQYDLRVDNGTHIAFLDTPLATVPTAGAWHHIVGTYADNGQGSFLYIDGVLVGSDPSAFGTFPTSGNSLFIGSRDHCDYGVLDCFDGKIDEVRVYSRKFSAAEVSALYRVSAANAGRSSALGVGVLSNGLVGHWTMDGADVSDKIYEKSGNANHGYFVGSATTSAKAVGRIGQALSFNGSSNYVDTTANAGVSNTSPFTLAGWFYSTAATNDQVMIATGIDTSPFDGVWLQWGSSSPCGAPNILTFAIVNSSGNEEGVCSSTTLTQGRWYHFVATYDGSQTIAGMKLYIDGAPETIGVQSNNGFGSFTDRPWRLGKDRHTNPSTYFSGKMDDVRVYNRTLSASEVKQLYNLGVQKVNTSSGTTGGDLNSGLVGHWTFDGTDVTDKVYDRSGSGNNGYFLWTGTSSAKTIGKHGQGMRFNGFGWDGINVGTSASLNPSVFTISGWIKPASTGNMNGNTYDSYSYNYIFGNSRDCCGTEKGIGLFVLSGILRGIIWDGTATSISQTGTIPPDQWTHVAFTYDGTNMRLYVNGVSDAAPVASAPPGTPASHVNCVGGMGYGAAVDCTNYVLNGSLDDVRVYNRALPATEIKQLYNLGR